MPITYPLSLPTTVPQAARFELVAVSSVGVSTSPFTFASQRQEYSGQHWDLSFTLPAMLRADAEQWIAFLLKLNGPTGTFLVGDPLGKTARGAATGTPLINGAGQTGQTIITDGWTNDITNILMVGDYIQIGNRLHKVLDDVDSGSSTGPATFDIWPRLRESPADDTPIIISNTKGLFRLTSTEIPLASLFGPQTGGLYAVSFSATEAI